MARIVFWGPNERCTGNTHSVIAVATLMGITHKATSLIMQGNYNSKKIESSFTPYEELKVSGALNNSSLGISALIRLVTSNKLTADAIQNYAKPILKGRLDILYGMNSNDIDGYNDLVNNFPYITRKAAEIYDLVFIDLPKTLDKKYIVDTLADSEIIVCVVNQDAVKLDTLFSPINNKEELKNKNKLFVIADYESKSRYNVSNIKIKYNIKDPIYTIPHNYMFADACNNGSIVDFLYRNINADPHDYNGNFINSTKQIVEKILEISKVKDN